MQVINITIRLILIILVTAISFFVALITLYILPYQYRAYIVKYWASALLKVTGAKIIIEGDKLDGYVNANHMVIANHISWLDIPILYSQYFVNFVGNIEGRDLYMNIADVIVCDGFTGNIVLKQAEGFFNIFKNRGLTDTYLDKFNYENYGGTPILGVQGNVVIGHGISNENAVKNMLMLAFEVSINKLSERIINAFK
jgi:hypothetical protein